MVLTWSAGGVTLAFAVRPDAPVALLSVRPASEPKAHLLSTGPPLVEIQAVGHGRFPGSHRYADTTTGARLRYQHHAAADDELRIVQADPVTGLVATSVFQAVGDVAAVRTWTEVTAEEPVQLQAVTSVVTGAFLLDADRAVDQ
ncbi:MAG: hypothetical protein ABIQ18_28775, partial [Umezawaea sp.]